MERSRIGKLEAKIDELIIEREEILKDMEALEDECERKKQEIEYLITKLTEYEMKELGIKTDEKCEDRTNEDNEEILKDMEIHIRYAHDK